MGSGSTGAQGARQSLNSGIVKNPRYYICPECGDNINPGFMSKQAHARHCGKPKPHHFLKCIKAIKPRTFIFYDKGQIHAFCLRELAKYLNINITTLHSRWHSGDWTLPQLLGKDTPPPLSIGGNPTGRNSPKTAKRGMNKKETRTQDLLRKCFKKPA